LIRSVRDVDVGLVPSEAGPSGDHLTLGADPGNGLPRSWQNELKRATVEVGTLQYPLRRRLG